MYIYSSVFEYRYTNIDMALQISINHKLLVKKHL